MSVTHLTSIDRLTDDINGWLREAVTESGESVYRTFRPNDDSRVEYVSKATFRLHRGLIEADITTNWLSIAGLWYYRVFLNLQPGGRQSIVPPSQALVELLRQQPARLLRVEDSLAWPENAGNDIRPLFYWTWRGPAEELTPDIRAYLI